MYVDKRSPFAPCPSSVYYIILCKSVHLQLAQVGYIVVADWNLIMVIYFSPSISLSSHRQSIIRYCRFPCLLANSPGHFFWSLYRHLKENYLVTSLLWSLLLKSQGIGSKEVPDAVRSLLRHRAASITWERRGWRVSQLYAALGACVTSYRLCWCLK